MENSVSKSLSILLVIIFIASAVALAGSHNSAIYRGVPVFASCAFVAFLINWLVYIPSNLKQTEKYYDLTGSITYLSVTWLAVALSGSTDTRSILAAAMVSVWAARLGTFLFIRISQDGHDDRFDEIKIRPFRFFNAWTIQGLWVLLTAACALAIITSNEKQPLELFGYIGAVIWLIGFLLEVVADRQKRTFRRDSANQGRFINVGLWSWSRHPNYFGEMTIWFGMAVMALPILNGWQYVCLISPIFVYLLLTKVSGIPLLQKKGLQKWGDDPAYQAYLANTSLLVPLPPKKR